MYSRVLKNNQVTYGAPFQIRIAQNFQNVMKIDCEREESALDDVEQTPAKPEDVLEKARRESEMIIREANLEAERLLEEAKNEAEKQAEEIFEQARKAGYEEGLESARRQYETRMAEAEELRRSACEEHDSIMAGMETEIVELVLDVARKVVSAEITANRSLVLNLVKEALANCSEKEGAVLRISPEDGDYLDENMGDLRSMVESADSIVIQKDNALKPGDCIIETSLGSVDASTDTRLERIGEAFREQLAGR